MNQHEGGSSTVPRRGFLRNLILTVAGAIGLAATVEPRLDEPEEKDLREADFYRKHNLAG